MRKACGGSKTEIRVLMVAYPCYLFSQSFNTLHPVAVVRTLSPNLISFPDPGVDWILPPALLFIITHEMHGTPLPPGLRAPTSLGRRG